MFSKKFKKIKKYIQILVSLVLLYIVLSWIDLGELSNYIKEIDYNYLLLSFIILTLDRILMAFKWNILLRVKNIRISLFEATKIYYISSFAGLLFPSTIGSDLIRTHLIVKKKNLLADVLSSIFVERIFGLIAILVYLLFSLPLLVQVFQNSYINSNQLLMLTVVAILLSIIVFFLTFNEKILGFINQFLKLIQGRKFLYKISKTIQSFIVSYQGYKKQKLILFIFFLLTLLEIFIGISINFFIAQSFHINISIAFFIAYLPIMMLLVRIPISLNGFGINEGGATFFLALAGVPKVIGFGIAIVDHFVNIIGILPGAFFYMFERDSKEDLLKNELPDEIV